MSDQEQPTPDFLDILDLSIHQTNRRHIAPQGMPDQMWKGGIVIDRKALEKNGLKARFKGLPAEVTGAEIVKK